MLVPLTAIGLLGISQLSARGRTVSYANQVRDSLVRVQALIAVREALHYEQSAADVRLRAVQFGLTNRAASALFGFSADGSVVHTRAVTDAALDHLATTTVPAAIMQTVSMPFDRATLQNLRDGIDNSAVSAAGADSGYAVLDGDAEEGLHALLDRLSSLILRVNGGYALWSRLEALHASSDGLSAGDSQASSMNQLALESGADAGPTLASLGEATSTYTADSDHFLDTGVPGLSEAWDQIDNETNVQIFEQAVQQAESAPLPAKPMFAQNPDSLATILRGGFSRNDQLFTLVGKTSAAVRSSATALVADATASYRDGWLMLIGLTLTSIVVALAAARFITRPMRRLADIAGAVSGGRLDVDTTVAGGPTETAVVAEAFDDLVSNLRLIESKSQALASCDFANPVLSEPLPGHLGRTIESSVEVLSGSIEERDKLQQRLAHQATHDALTGLHNRAAAVSALEQSLARAHRTGDAVGLLYIDLDDFKRANDNHGHQVGDQILKTVGSRMQAVVRGGDLLARIGGDEFLVVAERVRDVSEAAALGRRLIEAVSSPVESGGLRFTVGACVGVAMALDGADDPGHLLARADLALYRAKQRGRAKIEIYDEQLQEELQHRADVEQALSAALNGGHDGLVLHYQPVIDSGAGHVVTLEALIRWHRHGSAVLLPAEFIPVAETSDLIIDLDVWVLRHVARQIATWSAMPELADVRVAVNISGRHLLSLTLSDHLEAVLQETGIDPHRLIFEITETVLLSDLPTVASELTRVRAQGVRVAIDDFGTGYTSIAHLQHLPIDTIKIDRSFVRSVEHVRDRSLVRMVTDLSHNIGVDVVAEGVETAAQRDVLQGLGCDNLQGFLISRPAPAGEILEWMQARQQGDQQTARQ